MGKAIFIIDNMGAGFPVSAGDLMAIKSWLLSHEVKDADPSRVAACCSPTTTVHLASGANGEGVDSLVQPGRAYPAGAGKVVKSEL